MTPVLNFTKFKSFFKNKLVQSLLTVTSLVLSGQAIAATVDIATSPLVNSTTSQVLPNLMYILDNSGSMASNYMPDYVNDGGMCKSADGTFSSNCNPGDPPYFTHEFNSIYYNPAITYSPGLNADGSERTSMTSINTNGWKSVPLDGYGIQNTNQFEQAVPTGNVISLLPDSTKPVNSTGYPDRVWCNIGNPTPAQIQDPLVCQQNSQYIFPAGTFTTGKTKLGYPFYYNVNPGQYCTNENLTTCVDSSSPVTVAGVAYSVPAKLRWCDNANNCQKRYIDSTGFTRPKWTGITTGSAPVATIKLDPDTINGASPAQLKITGITVNAVSIIAAVPNPALTITDTTNLASRTSLAKNIRDAINNYVSAPVDFTATYAGDVVTIKPVGIVGSYIATLDVTTTKYPTTAFLGTKAIGSFTIDKASATASVTSITVKGKEILGLPRPAVGGDTALNRNALANLIVAQINSFPSMSSFVVGSPPLATAFIATSNGASKPIITITARNPGAVYNGALVATPSSSNIKITGQTNTAGGLNEIDAEKYTIPYSLTQFTGGTAAINSFVRVDIEPTTLSYPKAGGRTDCGDGTSTTCSYDEEMTNFANWYSYYRTRMQMMKTSTTRAFKLIDQRYRVGLITINTPATNYVPIADYTGAQKATWYNRLTAVSVNNSTPLREALSTTGKIFAGKKPIGTSDPVDYSCQQNFALLTTDGYWNGNAGSKVDNAAIGNQDGAGTGRPQFEGPTARPESLADVAKYYYDADLRTSALGNCTGGKGNDVCENNVFVSPTDNNVKQHMTTFTLGLGVDGELGYTPDYKTATSGDFYDIKQGTKNWSNPQANTQGAVDDLWHAAVNGQGTYFSAKDPNQLNTSLTETLQAIGSKVGAGAAAASSTLNPVAGDNFAYVASYSTVKWTGNLEARTINTNTGEVSKTANWCVENVLTGICNQPSSIIAEDVFGSTQAFCVTPSSTAATCSGPGSQLVGTDCKVEVPVSCVGTLSKPTIVGPALSNRKILIRDGNSNNLVDFRFSNLTAAQKIYFDKPFLSTSLSQWSALSAAQKNLAFGDNLVNYLRGESGYEDRASNSPPSVLTDNRVFRFREAVMGDALESTPLFVGKPRLDYADPGYGPVNDSTSFKATKATRAKTVFIGANDGMLHAFDADTGDERWAYIPSMVIPNMYKLADRTYATHHANFVNGDPTVADVCVANCSTASAVWKTLLVGGLNGGGSGYFALDITDTTDPKLMWEFTQDNDSDLGISYGRPIATKKADGTWVILVTSGYNNISGGNAGKGILYALNPVTGSIINKYSTGVGDATTPSGLAKVTGYADNPNSDNTAKFVYGGDLLGNLWRFDINSPNATAPFKVAVLKDKNGATQPITTTPEMTDVGGKRLIFVGTGKYLEISDLVDVQPQTLYAITDDPLNVTFDNPRAYEGTKMIKRQFTSGGAERYIATPADTATDPKDIDYVSGRGWFIDLPDPGERQNVSAQLIDGTLLIPTTVPSSTICSPGGYGWLNFVDYKNGTSVNDSTGPATNLAGTKYNSPIVGFNTYKVNGRYKTSVVTADNPTPDLNEKVPNQVGQKGFASHRVIWRELIDQE
jgi:type IV pilus assembly protein PilY1